MEGLHAWHEFYLLLGTAGATLLALLFVAVSLGTGFLNNKDQRGTRTFMRSRSDSLHQRVLHFRDMSHSFTRADVLCHADLRDGCRRCCRLDRHHRVGRPHRDDSICA